MTVFNFYVTLFLRAYILYITTTLLAIWNNIMYTRTMNAKDYTVTVEQYAERWHLNVQTVRRYCREKRLPYIKVGHRYYFNPDIAPLPVGETINDE